MLFLVINVSKCVVAVVVLFSNVAFKTLDISQGSAATNLRCGAIFSDSIITSFLLILTVKKLENRLIFDEVKAYKNCAIFGPLCAEHFLLRLSNYLRVKE